MEISWTKANDKHESRLRVNNRAPDPAIKVKYYTRLKVYRVLQRRAPEYNARWTVWSTVHETDTFENATSWAASVALLTGGTNLGNF
jgi:predicted oxidoreductase (fatty acid repression mutant protein)